MDLNSHESHPLEREKDQDAMDISLDLLQPNDRAGKQADPPLHAEASALPTSENVLERPREDENHPAVLDQNGKTSSRPSDILSVVLSL